MSPELANALTFLVYVLIAVSVATFVAWVVASIIAVRRFNRISKDFEKHRWR